MSTPPSDDRYRAIALPLGLRALVIATARLVPRLRRRAWLREWEAELTYAHTRAAATGRGRGRLVARALWSSVDALWVRTEEITMVRSMADARLAWRSLRRNPLFTAVTIATLALGIGANSAIFSIVNGVLLQPLPYEDSERLVLPIFEAPGLGYAEIPYSDGVYMFVRESLRSFEELAIWDEEEVNVVGEAEPERVYGARVTPSIFQVLRVAPAHGRAFNKADAEPGAEPVVILEHGLWKRRYGGEVDVIGRQFELDGVMRRVVGIMPEGLKFPGPHIQLWRPFELEPTRVGSFSYMGIARLADGATLEAAHEELATLIGRFGEQFGDRLPMSMLQQARFAPYIRPFKEAVVGDVRRPLMVILGTVGVVLLIACANVANLFLVRADGRQREVTLRAALGARRADLVRFYLTESLLLAGAGGIVGLGLAAIAVSAFAASAPVAIPRIETVRADATVLAFTAGISILAGTLFGLVPLIQQRGDLATRLREGGRTATIGGRALTTRNALVIAQVALALVLLIGSGLMVRSFQALRNVDPGFDPSDVLTVRLAPPGAQYPDGAARAVFWRAVLDSVTAVPGVTIAGGVSQVPLNGGRSAGSVRIEGVVTEEGELPPLADKRAAAAGYFTALGIPLLEGREFERDDGADGFRAAIVSASFARHWWPEESAIGKRVADDDGEEWFEVVGVVGDVRHESLEEPVAETLYLPLRTGSPDAIQAPGGLDLVVRVERGPEALLGSLRQAIWDVDPRVPIANLRTMQELVDDSLARTSFTLVMLGVAATAALVLGAIGIYGVISYIVSQRTQEIGLRLALGAPGASVRRMVVQRGLALTAIGITIGLAGAYGSSRLLGNLLFEVEGTDLATYATVTVGLGAIALMATWIPAVRASWVDPAVALRQE